LFGMDFTGGYSAQVELAKPDSEAVEKLSTYFVQQGASPRDFQIRQQASSTHCQILLSTAMELVGKPFHGLPLTIENGSNPRLDWVMHAFDEAGVALSTASQ